MLFNELPKVLVVDDEKRNLKILTILLRHDVDVIVAGDAQQALEKAKRFNPDLILLDVVMPGMDGFDVIKILKKDMATHMIPVIFITALSETKDEEKGLNLGACDYIQKPFQLAIVKARVKLHLQFVKQRKMLEQMANIDPLTSLANRRRYEEVLDNEWAAMQRNQQPLSLVMVDIDYFKQYNDRYGHAAGDTVLEQISLSLSKQLKRPRDFIARYGGEEFVIILSECNKEGAIKTIENCVAGIEQLQIEQQLPDEMRVVTISAGGTTCFPHLQDCKTDILKIADDMLYQAKNRGRNRLQWE